MLRRSPDGWGMISNTPTTWAPWHTMRRAMMRPMSPEPQDDGAAAGQASLQVHEVAARCRPRCTPDGRLPARLSAPSAALARARWPARRRGRASTGGRPAPLAAHAPHARRRRRMGVRVHDRRARQHRHRTGRGRGRSLAAFHGVAQDFAAGACGISATKGRGLSAVRRPSLRPGGLRREASPAASRAAYSGPVELHAETMEAEPVVHALLEDAAETRLPVHQHHARARQGGGARRRHARGAAAHDRHVAGLAAGARAARRGHGLAAHQVDVVAPRVHHHGRVDAALVERLRRQPRLARHDLHGLRRAEPSMAATHHGARAPLERVERQHGHGSVQGGHQLRPRSPRSSGTPRAPNAGRRRWRAPARPRTGRRRAERACAADRTWCAPPPPTGRPRHAPPARPRQAPT